MFFHRQVLFTHQQSLKEHLKEEQEPAMALHLVTVLLFQRHTNCIIHIPGKLVPCVLSFLATHMPTEDHSKLVQYQQLVVQQLILASNKGISSGGNNEPPKLDSRPEEQGRDETKVSGLQEQKEKMEEDDEESKSGVPLASNRDSVSVAQELQEKLAGLKQLVCRKT